MATESTHLLVKSMCIMLVLTSNGFYNSHFTVMEWVEQILHCHKKPSCSHKHYNGKAQGAQHWSGRAHNWFEQEVTFSYFKAVTVPKVPRSTVLTIVWKNKVHGTVVSLSWAGGKHKLSPAAERKLVRMLKKKHQKASVQWIRSCWKTDTSVHSQVCFAARKTLWSYEMKN